MIHDPTFEGHHLRAACAVVPRLILQAMGLTLPGKAGHLRRLVSPAFERGGAFQTLAGKLLSQLQE
jgi:hypothetical protein